MCFSNLSSAYAEGLKEQYKSEPYKTWDHIYFKDAIKYIVSYVTQWTL